MFHPFFSAVSAVSLLLIFIIFLMSHIKIRFIPLNAELGVNTDTGFHTKTARECADHRDRNDGLRSDRAGPASGVREKGLRLSQVVCVGPTSPDRGAPLPHDSPSTT